MEPLTFALAVQWSFYCLVLGWVGFVPLWVVAKFALWM